MLLKRFRWLASLATADEHGLIPLVACLIDRSSLSSQFQISKNLLILEADASIVVDFRLVLKVKRIQHMLHFAYKYIIIWVDYRENYSIRDFMFLDFTFFTHFLV